MAKSPMPARLFRIILALVLVLAVVPAINPLSARAENEVYSASSGASIEGAVTLLGQRVMSGARVVTITLRLFTPGTSASDIIISRGATAAFITNTVDTGFNTVSFSVSDVLPGTYDISVAGTHSLANVKRNFEILPGSNKLDLGVLVEGDCNLDGVINALDMSVMAASYSKGTGTVGFDARADLNNDRYVDGLDYSLLAGSYLKTGPVVLPEIATIRIGVVNPLTGSLSSLGGPATRGVEMAAADINAAGGLEVGGIRYSFEVLKEDDQGMAAGGSKALGRLMMKGAGYLVGATASAPVAVEVPWTEDNKMVNIIGVSIGSMILQQKKYTFRFADGGMMPPPHQSLPAWRFLKDLNPDLTSYFVAAPDHQGGWDTSQADMDAAEALGLALAGYSFYVPTVVDFRPLAAEILSKNPDMVDIRSSTLTSGAALIKALRNAGYQGKILGGGWRAEDLVRLVGNTELIEGVYGLQAATDGPELTSKIADFFQRYEARYGVRESAAADTYDMLFVLAEGMKKADSLNPDQIASALESLAGQQLDLLWGSTTIGGEAVYGRNAQILGPIPVTEIKNGQYVHLRTVSPVEVPPPTFDWW